MAQRKAELGDVGASDPSNWVAPFNHPSDIHAVLLIVADHSHVLQQKLRSITETPALTAGVEILLNQPGRTRLDLPGHEHFGFKDGISQPGIRGIDPPDDPIGNPNQGHPGQDLLWPGEFIIGYATQIATAKAGVDGPQSGSRPRQPSKSRLDGGWLLSRLPPFAARCSRVREPCYGTRPNPRLVDRADGRKAGRPLQERCTDRATPVSTRTLHTPLNRPRRS